MPLTLKGITNKRAPYYFWFQFTFRNFFLFVKTRKKWLFSVFLEDFSFPWVKTTNWFFRLQSIIIQDEEISEAEAKMQETKQSTHSNNWVWRFKDLVFFRFSQAFLWSLELSLCHFFHCVFGVWVAHFVIQNKIQNLEKGSDVEERLLVKEVLRFFELSSCFAINAWGSEEKQAPHWSPHLFGWTQAGMEFPLNLKVLFPN